MSATNIRKKFTDNREIFIQNIIRERIHDKFEDIKEYHKELEEKFETDKKRLSDRSEKEVSPAKISEETEEQIREYFSIEQLRIEDLFLKNFRYSVIVTIYSFLETTLNDLCHYLYHSKKLLLALDEVKGAGIDRAKLYLQKVCLINFPEKSHEWQEINKFNLIRNCIVHAEGNVEEVINSSKLKGIVRNTKGISLDRSIQRFLRIENSYISSIIECIEKFVETVHEEAFKAIPPVKS